jgi:RimJ/RimL family protein N-acetyltransferase
VQDVPIIRSERLYLVLLSPSVLEALSSGNGAAAAALIGASLPPDWPDGHLSAVSLRRLRQIAAKPQEAPWLLRAMVRVEDQHIVGYINFHGPPDEVGQVELGYTVAESERRRGYASEAILAMMAWAKSRHALSRFRLSISPTNTASLALADKLGFQRTGEQTDDEDGLEYVFERLVR